MLDINNHQKPKNIKILLKIFLLPLAQDRDYCVVIKSKVIKFLKSIFALQIEVNQKSTGYNP